MDSKLLNTTAPPELMPENAMVEFHTERASALAKELLDKMGVLIEEWFKQFPDEQISVQELSDRYNAPLIAARSLTVGSIACYCDALKCQIPPVFGMTMQAFAGQMSTLLPPKDGEKPS